MRDAAPRRLQQHSSKRHAAADGHDEMRGWIDALLIYQVRLESEKQQPRKEDAAQKVHEVEVRQSPRLDRLALVAVAQVIDRGRRDGQIGRAPKKHKWSFAPA